MSIRLTDSAIAKAAKDAAAAGQRRDLADAGCPGLRLRLTPAGGKGWVLACRDRHGAMRRFPIGTYPEKGISEARTAARALHMRVKHEGEDPIAQRRRDRLMGEAAKQGIGTLAAALDLYGEKRGNAQRAWPDVRKRVNRIFAPLLARPAETLTGRDFQMLADAYPSQSSASYAVRALRPALKWAAHRGYLPEDIARIHPPAAVKRRDRVLSREELAKLLPIMRGSDRPHTAAMLFMLLTLCRREEAGSARWRDIDFETGLWTIPHTKNGQPHSVPLSRQALALLRARMPAEPDPSALIFATSTGGTLSNWDRMTKLLQAECGVMNFTRHDLRRTGATLLGEMGELPDIVEAALNHASIRSPLAATYNRSRYRPQVAAALQRLADALDGIATGACEVVPFPLRA